MGNIVLVLSASFLQESNTSRLLLPVSAATESVLWTEVDPCRELSEFCSYESGEVVKNILHRMFLLVIVFSNPVDLVSLAVLLL